jgi:hypothetical protein
VGERKEDSRASSRFLFDEILLLAGQRRLGAFGASLGLELITLAIVVVLPFLAPQKLEVVRHYWVMPLEAPHIEAWKPQPPKPTAVKQVVAQQVPKPKVEQVVPEAKIYIPVITAPVAKAVAPKKVQAPDMTEVAKAFPEPKPPLSMGSSAIPTLQKPREAVQTGGFGDPNGVPDNGKTNRNPNLTQLGGYDMPGGPGTGNGAGGSKGEKGVVASTGFGDGAAQGTPGSNHGSVKQGVFADEQAVAVGARAKQTAATSRTTPVEILFKPIPQYTDEAGSRKIERL